MNFLSFKSKDIGIDLGTANILVTIKGKGIVLREPSVISVDTKNGNIIATGFEAKEMVGRTPKEINAIKPLKDGVIADFTATKLLLKNLLERVCKRYNAIRPRVLVGVPSGITEVEERAVEEAIMRAGAREVYLIEEPMSAAVGADIEIEEPSGNIIVDIGGGTTDIAVLSLGDIVTSSSLKIAGDVMDEDIIKFVKDKYKLLIGDRTAEQIKMQIGTAIKGISEEIFEVRGRDLVTGLPHTITITADETELALRETCQTIVRETKHVLEQTPPELAADIVSRGIFLTGGGALLNGLDRLLESELNVPVFVADDALNCVANGCGVMLENLHYMK